MEILRHGGGLLTRRAGGRRHSLTGTPMTTVNRAEMVKRLYELELEDRAVVIGFALMLVMLRSL